MALIAFKTGGPSCLHPNLHHHHAGRGTSIGVTNATSVAAVTTKALVAMTTALDLLLPTVVPDRLLMVLGPPPTTQGLGPSICGPGHRRLILRLDQPTPCSLVHTSSGLASGGVPPLTALLARGILPLALATNFQTMALQQPPQHEWYFNFGATTDMTLDASILL
jgi:hypothetical protein